MIAPASISATSTKPPARFSDLASVPGAGAPARAGLRAGLRAGVAAVARDQAWSTARDAIVGDSAHQRGAEAMGRMLGSHLFAENLILLVNVYNCSPLVLNLTVEQSGIFGRSSNFVRMVLMSSDHHNARHVFQQMNPVLIDADLNGFGVLSALARIFGEYGLDAQRAPGDGRYWLNITITAT